MLAVAAPLLLVLVTAPIPTVALAFTVSSFTPLHGSYAGGTLVNVSGSGFLRGGIQVSAVVQVLRVGRMAWQLAVSPGPAQVLIPLASRCGSIPQRLIACIGDSLRYFRDKHRRSSETHRAR